MMHYVNDDSSSPSPTQEFHQTIGSTFGYPIVLEIPVVSEVTNIPAFWAAPTDVFEASEVPASQPQVPLQVFVKGSGTVSSPLVSHDSPSQYLEEVTPPPPPFKVPGST
ncbi:hypothetical protein ACFX15_039642 [Malus domestica]